MEYVISITKFKDNVSDEKIFNIQSKYYKDNEKEIKGCIHDTLRNEESFKEFMKMYNGFKGSN